MFRDAMYFILPLLHFHLQIFDEEQDHDRHKQIEIFFLFQSNRLASMIGRGIWDQGYSSCSNNLGN